MRILLYNFVQGDEPGGKEGGGVAIYQRNLARTLREAGHQVVCLSAGHRYSLFRRRPRIVFRRRAGAEQAIVYNSPVFAPAHAAFSSLEAYTKSGALNEIPGRLFRRYGRFDVLHFQNVEGLTAGFFRALRSAFPDSRILISAHNYNLVCPQVNLWYRERSVCTDHNGGMACVNCLTAPDRLPYELNRRRMETILRPFGLTQTDPAARPIAWVVRGAARVLKRLSRASPPLKANRGRETRLVTSDEEMARPYAAFHEANLRLVAEVFDAVIAVSNRAADVLVARGVPRSKIAVSYIGTRHYEAFQRARRRWEVGATVHVAFLGYMRADKGFYFLLAALHQLPADVARRIRLTIAAPIRERSSLDQLKALSRRYRSVVVRDGYRQEDLPELLADVDLGVVPVLWEDNLPQVAIEFVAHGAPILTSDRGGAQEIGSNPHFIFRAGSTGDFCDKLTDLVLGTVRLGSFWSRPPQIRSMAAHVDDLMRIYAPADACVGARSPRLAHAGEALQTAQDGEERGCWDLPGRA